MPKIVFCPPDFARAHIDENTIPPTVRRWADEFQHRWTRTPEMGLYLHGKPGVGKTVAALWAAQTVPAAGLPRGYPACFLTADELVRWYQDVYVEAFEVGARRFIRSLECETSPVSILIIDDLGIETRSEFKTSVITSLLRRRARLGYPTIITSNLTPAGVGARYGERAGSYLAEKFVAVRLKGEDRRA